MERKSTILSLLGAIVLFGVVFLVLAWTIEGQHKRSLYGLYEKASGDQAHLLARFLGQSFESEDDLSLLKTLSDINKFGFYGGLIYDIRGIPLYASQPRLLEQAKSLSPGLIDSFKRDSSLLNRSCVTPQGQQTLQLIIRNGQKWHGILELNLDRPSLSSTQLTHIRISYFIAFIVCLAASALLVFLERRRLEKNSPLAAQIPNDKIMASVPAAVESPALLEILWKTHAEHLVFTRDNHIIFSSPQAKEQLGARAGGHLLEMEKCFPRDVEKLVGEEETDAVELIAVDGRSWRLAIHKDQAQRLLIFTPK